MLTDDFFFGMNLLSVAGFILMGLGLTLNRQKRLRMPMVFALMGAGTVLVFLGVYVAPPATP